MTVHDFAGLAAGLAGASLFLAGVLVALLAAIRLAFAFRQPPARTRVARGLVAGSSVTGALGAALFWASELLPGRRGLDRAAPWAAAVAVAIGAWLTLRVARRVPPAAPAREPSAPPRGDAP